MTMERPHRRFARLRLPAEIGIRYGRLVKAGFWALALAWMIGAGHAVEVGTIFKSQPDYVRQNLKASCRSQPTPTARAECFTRATIGFDNRKFYKVAMVLLPPLVLIPICSARLRRIGKSAERRLRIPLPF